MLLAWNGFQAWRMTFPMRAGHESYISRQIGRSALIHVTAGPARTKLANVSSLKRDGGLIVHRSYGPACSLMVALPLALGFPYDLAVRLPALISMNLLLVGTGMLARRLGGPRAAVGAVLVAGMAPVVLYRYALLCVFENLGLGPCMLAVGLGLEASTRRRAWAVCTLATIAALCSWIFWVPLVPWIGWHVWKTRRRGLAVGWIAMVLVPVGAYLGTLQAVTGDCLGDVRVFLGHIGERVSRSTFRPGDDTTLTSRFMVELNFVRLTRNLGWVPLAISAVTLAACGLRRRRRQLTWCLGLLALALPLNFAPNLSYQHDFFVLLYIPAVALACGLLLGRLGDTSRRRAAHMIALGLIAGFLLIDVLPKSWLLRAWPEDYRQEEIARILGERIRPEDMVIADASACTPDPNRLVSPEQTQEQVLLPLYAGRICQTALVARGPEEVAHLASQRPGERRVFVINFGSTRWSLPEHFRECTPRSPVPRFQFWEYGGAAIATGDRGVVTKPVRR
jgi:hypothetical protein